MFVNSFIAIKQYTPCYTDAILYEKYLSRFTIYGTAREMIKYYEKINGRGKINGKYRRLDLMRANVRKAILEYNGEHAKDLYLNDAIASDYK